MANLLYRTSTSATTPSSTSAKGSPLTNLEIDGNFKSVNDDLSSKITSDGSATLTNKTFDTAGTGNTLKINGTAVSDKTGTGKVVLDTSPTLTAPILGAATATTLNKITFTQPASGSTLTIIDGKTLTTNKTLTLDGTDGKTLSVNKSLTLDGTDSKTLSVNNTITLNAGSDGVTVNVGAGGTMANLGSNAFTAPQIPSISAETAPTSNAVTWDITSKQVLRLNLNANITTFTVSGTLASYAGVSYMVVVRYNGGSSITWPTSVKWAAGTAPTLTGTSGKVDIFFFSIETTDGTNYYLCDTGNRQNVG
jgi:hypothetical protein